MEALTPAAADDLPPLGELVVDDPFWRYLVSGATRKGLAHLRVWLTTGPEPGHLAVVTETGSAASVTESAADEFVNYLAVQPDALSGGSALMMLAYAGALVMVTRAEMSDRYGSEPGRPR